MKTEEKARAYDEAIRKAAALYKASEPMSGCNVIIETLFPEIKESEDERIRKELLEHCKNQAKPYIQTGNKCPQIQSWIDWLEKQAAPQVRTGIEWVNTIDDACDERYIEEYSHGEYCHEQSFKWGFQEGVEWLEKQGEKKPIDKIQLGKKYKRIASPRYSTFRRGNIYKPVDNFLCNLMNLCYECFELIEDSEQKPTDEDMKEALRTEYEKGRADAFAQMQKEWSEEDEKNFCSVYLDVKSARQNTVNSLSGELKEQEQKRMDEVIYWLKSLRPQNKWKPSDEQMRVLDLAIRCGINRGTTEETTLVSLFNDLKKLIKL